MSRWFRRWRHPHPAELDADPGMQHGVAQIVIDVERDALGMFEFVVRTRPTLDAKTCAETLRFAARELDKQWSP